MKILNNNINKEKIVELTEFLDLEYSLYDETYDEFEKIINKFKIKIPERLGCYGNLNYFSKNELIELYIGLLNLKNKYEK